MGNYNETNIDLLLEQELNKFIGLIKKIQETNENVLRNSSLIDEIKQKYEDISLTLSDIENKFNDSNRSSDFVNIKEFNTHKGEIDSQLIQIKRAQINLNNQLGEFDNLLKDIKPTIDETLNKKTNGFVSIDSYEKGIKNLEQSFEQTIKDSIEKIEIEKIKSSFNAVLKEVEDSLRYAEEINKNKINKLEADTSDNLQKIKNQINELTPKIEKSINKQASQYVSIESFNNEIKDIHQTIEINTSNSIQKNEIEEIKNSLDIVIKDVGEIYRLAGKIDKERISKLEVKTIDNLRKINDQINQFSLKIEKQSETLVLIKRELSGLVTKSKLHEFEKQISINTINLNREINDLKLQNKQLTKQMSNLKGYNVTFVIISVIFAIITIIALKN